jgi:hypothetical protein
MQGAVIKIFRWASALGAIILCVGQCVILLGYDLTDVRRPEGMGLPFVSLAILLMTYTWTSFFDKPVWTMSARSFFGLMLACGLGLLGIYIACFGQMPQSSRIHLNAPVNAALAFVFFFFALLGVAGDRHVRWMRRFKAGVNS